MDLRKEIYAHCFNPVQVSIYNPVTMQQEMREVPCGKCYHCRITQVNEWVTRMVLETMYNKYCYFVTLTYSRRSVHTDVFSETYPCMSSSNQFGEIQPTPLVLRKDHLQKFFKRLRKNTCIKFKYYACGEYGHKYARPHYHMILWSNDPISKMDIYRAWSTTDVYGYRRIIGRIDYNDLMQNGTMSSRHSFKYVCKYLQKRDFDFDKLPTCSNHNKLKDRLYGKSSWLDAKNARVVKSIESKDEIDVLYRKAFGPFMLCSKSPSIGSGYLYDHIDRFQEKDFRLFGVQDKDLIFPRYYVRKTKEVLCPFKCISKVNDMPSSSAGVPGLETMLVAIQNCIDFNEGFLAHCPLVQIDRRARLVYFSDHYFGEHARISWRQFNFYNCASKEYFLFAGDRYIRIRKVRGGIVLQGTSTVRDVLDRLNYSFVKLLEKLLVPFEYSRTQSEHEKEQMIKGEFGTEDCYKKFRSDHLSALLSFIDHRQSMYYVSKNKF